MIKIIDGMLSRNGLGLARTLLVLAATFALQVSAIASETTAAIKGRVTDGNDPLSGVSVVVTDQRTGSVRKVSTNEGGNFLASKLAVGGPYQVKVDDDRTVTVDSLALGDVYELYIDMSDSVEEIVVTATSSSFMEISAGPTAQFSSVDLDRAISIERDIKDVYSIDPRIHADGFAINCTGKSPRFNTVTLDGVRYSDMFGLNSNGYSSAIGMPFPYDAVEQVTVELAPANAKVSGFSACNMNAVTKRGSNEFTGNVFYESTQDSWRGDTMGNGDTYTFQDYDETKLGFSFQGPIIKDKLFFSVAYEEAEEPRFLAHGYSGSGNGEERPWLSKEDYDRIVDLSKNVYNYDPGALPGDGVQEVEKYFARVDWVINDQHELAVIYNYNDDFQDRSSDSDSDEFEFSNHFYRKGSEVTTISGQLKSYWTDALSTELFIANNEMDDSQVTIGPKEFGDHQISINGRDGVVYLGADDSRQGNKLSYETQYIRISGEYLLDNQVISFGFDRQELDVFNMFVQHSRGGEYDYFDSSADNSDACNALDAAGRLADAECGLSGIDRFELGRPSRFYYGSGGGTNIASDAAAKYTSKTNSIYLQDEFSLYNYNLTITAGVRYEWYQKDERPVYNEAFSAYGIRNDATIDGLNIFMPRLGVVWSPLSELEVRASAGRYSGGNPLVWISNAFSNDGITNAQQRINNYGAENTVLPGSDDSWTLSGAGRPGYDIPQEMLDRVLSTSEEDASDSRLSLLDPNYEQPSEWKYAIGATYQVPYWGGFQLDVDFIHTQVEDPAWYIDVSQEQTGTTAANQAIYEYVNGSENYMLTNGPDEGDSSTFSFSARKAFDFDDKGELDLMLGYAHTKAKDISPMTAAVAYSNFGNLALNDIFNPAPGTSDYVIPHRATLRASYEVNLFGDNKTRFILYAYRYEGQPGSFSMAGGSVLEGSRYNSRHLLYVPAVNDPYVTYADGFDRAGFDAFIAQHGLQPGFVERNSVHAAWTSRIDLRIDQEIPLGFEDVKARAFLKIYNFGNLLNDEWGLITDAEYSPRAIIGDLSVNGAGQYVYGDFRNRSINDVRSTSSLYEIKAGIEVRF